MSKKIFYTDTSVPPTRLVESGSVGGTGGLPEIAALDPLMAASNFEPDPAFAPSEEEIQNQISQLNTELDQALAQLDRVIAAMRSRLEDSNGKDATAQSNLDNSIQAKVALRAITQDRINNVRQQLSSNNFSWLRKRGFSASTVSLLMSRKIYLTGEDPWAGLMVTQSNLLWCRDCYLSMQTLRLQESASLSMRCMLLGYKERLDRLRNL